MSAELFIDTNVFVYHLDGSDARKQAVAEGIVRTALLTANGCISFQVVQECMNVALRKARVRLQPEAARTYLDAVLVPLLRISASPALYHRALDIQKRWQFSFYDSLIIAAALSAGCSRLLSEDMQHGQQVESLMIENPFRG